MIGTRALALAVFTAAAAAVLAGAQPAGPLREGDLSTDFGSAGIVNYSIFW